MKRNIQYERRNGRGYKTQERELSGKQDRSKMSGQKESEEIIKENW
jgi:hypothetical protein